MMRTILNLLLILLPQLLWCQKETFDIQHFSIKNGLSDNQTLHIEQDKDGYIWGNSVGTLFRYDGYQFKTYRKRELDVSGVEFVKFVIDDEGLVWYFDFDTPPLSVQILDAAQHTFTPIDEFFKHKLPFPSDDVTNIYKDRQLGFVIVTKKNGFYTYQNRQFKQLFQHYAPLEYSRITGKPKGKKWYFHQDTLFSVSALGERSFTIKQDLIIDVFTVNNSIYAWYGSFFEDNTRLRFSEMVNYVKSEKPKYEKINGTTIAWLEDKTPHTGYFFPMLDQGGTSWIIQKETKQDIIIGRSKNGEIVFRQSMLLNDKKNNQGAVKVALREIFADKQNNLWVTSDNGLYKISRRQTPFKAYLSGKSTRGMLRLGNQLIVNHDNVSLLNLENGQERDLKLPFRRLTFLQENSQLWIGTQFGLTYWNEAWNSTDWTTTDWKGKVYFSELRGYQNITPFRPQGSDRILLGTSKGLAYFDPKTDKIHPFPTEDEALNTATVRYIFENKKGVWCVSNQGVFLVNKQGKVLQELSEKTGFPTNDFYHLHEDKNGVFWLGTADAGLVAWQLKTNEITVFGREQGFLNENIYAVYEDDNGFLWLPSDYGLIRFNKETHEVNTFLEEHGLPNNEFNTYSHYQDSLGNLYFGGINGIVAFHPKDFVKNTAVDIPLHLTAFKVMSEGNNQLTDKTKTVRKSGKITFRPKDKFFEIHFALMDFKNINQRLYAYKIKGFDEDWRYTTDNFIRIYTLPYGNYELIVKGQVDGTAWSNQTLSFRVSVLKPFYLQWWFIGLAVALVAFGVFSFFKNRTQNLLKEQVRLEGMVASRTAKIELDKKVIEQQSEELREMDKIKTKFFSNITHEFRTPLTLILGPAKQLYETETEPEKQERLAGIFKNARHLLTLINQLLDLSKLASRQMAIDWEYGDIIEYTEAFLNDFRTLAKSKQQKLVFFANSTSWETYFDKDKWHKIVFNLLSNAIKYTEENGEIILKIHRKLQDGSESIYLKVEDDGIGIRQEVLPKIFDRFYQIDGSTTRLQQGAGIGLALIKELVELQNGTITVQSTEGKGTVFEIHIPIPQNLNEMLKINAKSRLQHHDFLQEIPIVVPIANEATTSQPIETEMLQVLVIEDNAEMRAYLKSCLDNTKYQIIEAKDGEEGIEKAIAHIPDMIISDVMMPRKDGFEVVTAIRQNVATSHIPVVLLTAKSALESRLEGLRRGADAYLTKPFSPKELVATIEQLLHIRKILQQRYQNQTEPKPTDEAATTYEQEDAFITELRAYILQNISKPQLSVTTISEQFYMSRTQLYRKVKALTDDNVTNFILKIRLDFAVSLIKTKQHSLSEIAYDAGFSSPSYFSTVFKKVYGKSPSEFAI